MKKENRSEVFIIGIIILISGCRDLPKNPYAELFKTSFATNSENYSKKGQWQDRVFVIGKSQVEFVKDLNIIDGFDEIPVPPKKIRDMQERIRRIQQSLPEKINTILDQYLYGIYFCENLGGTGISGIIYDKGIAKGGFIIIDANMVEKSANDWITAKENSVFNSKKIKLRIEIEGGGNNNRENALKYIFLHEFGHILSVVKGIAPDFREKKRDFAAFPFFKGIWIHESYPVTDDSVFKLRPSVKFYSEKKISLDNDWKSVYQDLANTSFPTLYSSTNADDHFAESFVSFVHCIIENKRWELILSDEKEEIYRIKNGITEPRSARERNFIENLLRE